LNGWQWASGNVRLQPGTWLPRTYGLAENRPEWSGKLETYTESVGSVGPDGQGSSGRHVRSRMARLAVGQRQRAGRTGAGLAATEWPPSGARGLGLSERRAGSGLGSGRRKLETHVVCVGSVRQERAGAACDDTGGAGWRGWRWVSGNARTGRWWASLRRNGRRWE